MRPVLSLLAVVWLAVAAWQTPLAGAFPSPQGFVNDFAGLLNESSRAELEALLRETQNTASAEVVLVTVRSFDGMTVEEYAARLFEQWGIGQRAADNGVLILVSPTERSMRIEVGYGLEPILPDGLAGEIIRDQFLPAFKDGDYGRGIRQGVVRVVDVVRRGDVALSPSVAPSDDAPPLWFVIPFFGLFVGLGSFAIGLGVSSRTYGPIFWGGLFAGGPLFMSLIFAPVALILGPFGVGILAWGYSKGKSDYWMKTLRGSTARTDSSDGWMMGSSGSSGSSSNSGSSSDFGGGSSGGGGASGRW